LLVFAHPWVVAVVAVVAAAEAVGVATGTAGPARMIMRIRRWFVN
jgi:hypothetical protein